MDVQPATDPRVGADNSPQDALPTQRDSSTPLIVARNLTKMYGSVTALDDADFECYPGEVHALVGENGAGKSTVSKILAGAVKPTKGSVTLGGEPFRVNSIAEARELGVVCAFQELALVPEWTVAENLMLPGHRGRGFFSQKTAIRHAAELLTSLELFHIDPAEPIGSLLLADRQLIEIARAIAAKPKVLILDEASSALNPLGVSWLFDRIRELTAAGVAIIYVSHRLSELAEIADTGTVLRDGASVGTFTRGSWTEDELVSMMAGRAASKLFPTPPPAPAPDAKPVLLVRNLRSPGIETMDLSLLPGEILGIGGLQGHGQTQLLRALYGAAPATADEWLISGRKTRRLTPIRAVKAGLGFVPEDRKHEGLALQLGVGENLLAPWLKPYAPGGSLQVQKERSWIDGVISSLSVRTRGPKEPAASLSGGNQQKLVFGRWLDRDRKVLFLHDPTRGIDVRAKQELYAAMMKLAENGVAIVWFSTEVEELVHMSHRVIVLYKGRLTGELTGDDITADSVVGVAVGARATA